ncbi:hypothetical protein BST81_19905 [Leptolyngbya sp. 'hensonii']|uniref:PAS domain S-box protein n=1 Tax=Leptolyngbya sp. 'hensonii' TaxID=1922337 RepID=UPI00094FBF1C|nr:PAS domain S-box protein [Leptolyngbya sp. 'hensonii']OLP16705.1 hypothetical protein BST81_19905 [Leptolyngbya sp. 'hensonii']
MDNQVLPTLLLIDDCAEDRLTYHRFLEQGSFSAYRIVECETAAEAIRSCQQSIPDVVLLDLNLPDGHGLEVLQEIRSHLPATRMAIIILTGQEDVSTAIRAMKAGAQDYLTKDRLTAGALQRAIEEAVSQLDRNRPCVQAQDCPRQITYEQFQSELAQREQAELALHQSERTLKLFVKYAPAGIAMLDRNLCYVMASQRWIEDYQLGSILSVVGRSHYDIFPEIPERWQQIHQRCLAGAIERCEEDLFERADGTQQWIRWEVRPWYTITQEIGGIIIFSEDITDRKRAEIALRDSEERLRLTLTAAKQGLYDVNIATGEVIVNPAYALMLGYDPATFQETADRWVKRLHPDDREQAADLYRAYVAGEIPEYRSEFRLQTQTGDWKWVLSLGKIVDWDAEGKPLRMLGTHTDITNRKQVEVASQQAYQTLETLVAERTAELSQLNHRLSQLAAIVESSNDAIISKTLEGIITSWNPGAEKLFGYTAAEAVGQSIMMLIPANLQAEESHILEQLHQGREIGQYETVRQRKDGQQIEVALSIFPIKDAEGNITGAAKIAHDISERKRTEVALAQYAREVEDLYNNAPCGYHSLAPEGRFIRVNETELKWLGYSREEMIGKPLIDFFTPASRSASFQDYPAFQKQGWVKNLAYEMVCKDGTILPVLISATAVMDAEGKHLYNRATLLDIRDLKQTEAQLRSLSDRLVLALQAGAIGSWELTPDGQGHWDARMYELYGLPPAEQPPELQDWLNLIHPDDRAEVEAVHEAAIQTNQDIDIEFRVIHPDGSIHFIKACVLLQHNEQGLLSRMIGINYDITDRKQAEAQLQQTNEQLALNNLELARATRLKDEFLANMSHELRTPLNAVLGMSEGLQDGIFGSINERQAQAISIIESSGRHLLALINDILDLAKIESGKLELESSDVFIPNLCDMSLTFVRQMAAQKKIQLKSCVPAGIGSIQGDDLRLRQVLINLLSNAIKFTPDGGAVTLEVARACSPGQDYGAVLSPLSSSKPCIGSSYLYFSITDTGIGIAPADLEKLSQPFVQVDSSLSRRYSGTGLGLSLVRRIAELHGGDVRVRSQLGQGSCFTVRIPDRVYLHEPEMLQVPSPTEPSAEILPNASTPERPASSQLILLAEDNEANVETIASYLESWNYPLILASNGQAAIDLTQKHHPDLILMDIQMPGVDGLEAIRQIRQNPEFAKVPIIALTALAMAGDREKTLAAGATEYLAKPVSFKQLESLIHHLLAERPI